MSISFRTRLLIITVLIVAAVLATVMFLGWSRLLAYDIERLDDRLCMEARRLAGQPLQPDRMAEMESDIVDKLRLASSAQLMLRVDINKDTSIDTGHDLSSVRSTYWSNALDTEKLTWARAPRQLDLVPHQLDSPPRSPSSRLQTEPPPRSPHEPGDGPPRDQREPMQRDPRPPRGTCYLASFTDQSRPDSQGTEWRVAKFDLTGLVDTRSSNAVRSIIAADLAATKAELQSAVTSALTLVIPLALVLVALGAWLLSGLMMRPVNRLRSAMQGVTRNALDQRLSAQGEDHEFAELIEAYNTMLQRLEASFHQASRFSADAAHELRTPLTILQGRIEQAVNMSDRRAIQSDLVSMLDEVGRMSAITRKLLLLSRADAGRLALHLESIRLTGLLDELIADAQLLVEGQLLQSAINKNLHLQGDELLLRQLFNNLISNAVRYCPPGGWIKVSAQALPGGIEVCFANRSQPITAAERGRFFDRFYRGDAAHNRQIDGSGLGLSLAREIARAHGGDLVLLAGPADEVTLRLWMLLKP